MEILKNKFFAVLLLIIFFSASIYIYGDIDGRTGRTLKTSTSGCSCHGSSVTTGVSVVLNGPDTVITGQTIQYSLTVTRSTKTAAGLDIAVRRGTLSPVSSTIHLASGELTHNDNIPFSGGTMTVQFNYVAPATAGIDTIWANGLASNSGSNSGGDEWNYAQSKRIVVKLPTGIENISSANDFSISQNYPNPFNPLTSIRLELSKSMNINVKIFDNLGNEIETLQNGMMKAGNNILKWDAAGFPSGVYFYTVSGSNFSLTRKMTLIK